MTLVPLKDVISRVAPATRQKHEVRTTCPRCGGVLLSKQGRYGDFLGCVNWPECRYTERVR